LEKLDTSLDGQAFFQTVATSFNTHDEILSLLKKTELAETRENYREETKLLFELKKQAEFKITLQNYVLKMLSYKEKYYYNAALNLEKNKKWTEAQDLYQAVLAINPDNFNANYRMALLCITLQNIEGSFNYLQQAMRINKDHPRVLMQMGVLYFSSGKTEEAIEYFNKALQQNEKTPQIYRYLGLCYEKTGNLYDAEKYYTKAIAADPNDIDTKARLDEVRVLIEKDSKKWETPEQKNESDVEQDAEMPLPVSKGAYDVRLKDDDMSLPMIDPLTGEEIKTDKTADGNAQSNQPGANKPPITENEKK
jgi:tetratricopeptide (TPR) repeat protein